jgi:hypothetical protein
LIVAPAASASSAAYMEGTPTRTVTPASHSKRGDSTSRAPAAAAAFSVHVWPNACASGRAPSTASSGPKPNSSAVVRALCIRFACVSSAPFGRPVVPDV